MVLTDSAKSGLESGALIDGYDFQKKALPLPKIRVRYFFHAGFLNKKHVIPRSVIAAILDVILNI